MKLSLIVLPFLYHVAFGDMVLEDFSDPSRYLDGANLLGQDTSDDGTMKINLPASNGLLSNLTLQRANADSYWYSLTGCHDARQISAIKIDIKSSSPLSNITIGLHLSKGIAIEPPPATLCDTRIKLDTTLSVTNVLKTYTLPLTRWTSSLNHGLYAVVLWNLPAGVKFTVGNVTLVSSTQWGACADYSRGCINTSSFPKYLSNTGVHRFQVNVWTNITRQIHIRALYSGKVVGTVVKTVNGSNSTQKVQVALKYPLPLPANGLSLDGYFQLGSVVTAKASVNLVDNNNNYATKYTICKPGLFALTFDDAPSKYTSSLLDYLSSQKVMATFFVNGNATSFFDGSPVGVDIYPNVSRRIASDGHLIASHTYTHPWLTSLNQTQVVSEMISIEDSLSKLGLPKPKIMRPPHSATNAEVDKTLKDLGYINFSENIDSYDWFLLKDVYSSFATFKYNLDNANVATDGHVSLQHSSTPYNVMLTKMVVDYVRSKGYQFVTVDKCI
ncbi:uncharacterized protein SPPG_07097 [Spizellomyces punctatus DAOM BR117]|uniref:NodB homology domain-containing protein n=1 Tax=Spizellomyces punctatus (strain DAOM BR117) TaxID=645134 RepID=A0A0L0H9Q3_SPIPD|nr:uncharacterized protein SPPG_07097 [Spizellomyces punctatus DAOM BR117]KNC97629.1 hypothetical protein SPPG_07097 [Spizellomyces punctatus DAOM BR117]|eukprot:XP_016605669.1 hypothetical protein SPPG_07097 [Spizellomyces punctatus DAOM BR117]